MHYLNGTALFLLNRPAEALSPLETAARLMPGSHLFLWVVAYRAWSLHALGRWAEAAAANDECIELYPSYGCFHIFKARLCVLLGREEEATRHIAAARRLGWDLTLTEIFWRRTLTRNPALVVADLASLRALFAATEAGA